jgi:hypothetical protein
VTQGSPDARQVADAGLKSRRSSVLRALRWILVPDLGVSRSCTGGRCGSLRR